MVVAMHRNDNMPLRRFTTHTMACPGEVLKQQMGRKDASFQVPGMDYLAGTEEDKPTNPVIDMGHQLVLRSGRAARNNGLVPFLFL